VGDIAILAVPFDDRNFNQIAVQDQRVVTSANRNHLVQMLVIDFAFV